MNSTHHRSTIVFGSLSLIDLEKGEIHLEREQEIQVIFDRRVLRSSSANDLEKRQVDFTNLRSTINLENK